MVWNEEDAGGYGSCFHGHLLALVILRARKRVCNHLAGSGEDSDGAKLGGWTCAISDCNDIIAIMASLTIRNLEEGTKRKLKVRAAMHGHSMEQEAREILTSALRQTPKTGADLAEAIRRRFAPLGGVNLEPYPRQPMRDPDWLKDWK